MKPVSRLEQTLLIFGVVACFVWGGFVLHMHQVEMRARRGVEKSQFNYEVQYPAPNFVADQRNHPKWNGKTYECPDGEIVKGAWESTGKNASLMECVYDPTDPKFDLSNSQIPCPEGWTCGTDFAMSNTLSPPWPPSTIMRHVSRACPEGYLCTTRKGKDYVIIPQHEVPLETFIDACCLLR